MQVTIETSLTKEQVLAFIRAGLQLEMAQLTATAPPKNSGNPVVSVVSKRKPRPRSARKGNGLTPEGRKILSENMRARWAARRTSQAPPKSGGELPRSPLELSPNDEMVRQSILSTI